MATSIDTEQAALKVFAIPELAHLVCASNQKCDNASLMRVCRRIFRSILPLVWEKVDGVVPLVSMIPGGGVVNYGADSLPPLVVMRCPSPLDLSRFNIYAPFVKRLTLPLVFHVDEHENWDEFLACASSIDLLPNLESIHLTFTDNYFHPDYGTEIGLDLVNWVTAFLSSSIVALIMAPPVTVPGSLCSGWLGLALSHKLLTSVSKKCPKIRTLKILPADVVVRVSGYRWQSSIQRFSFYCDSWAIDPVLPHGNLVCLMISTFVLSPEVLYAVAKLPALESLCILGIEEDRIAYCDGVQLSAQSFPVLKHLELTRLTKETVLNICNLKAFVVTLSSLSITHPLGSDAHLDTNLTIFGIVAAVAVYNSKLSKLSIRLNDTLITRPKSIESWALLPLVTLHFWWDIFYYDNFEILHQLLSRLPLLEDLSIGNLGFEGFDLQQLRLIIGVLPHLCRIWIPIAWESVLQLTQADFRPLLSHSENELRLTSHFYLPEPQPESAEDIARFIFGLRPASRIICESARPFFYNFSTGEYVYQEQKDMINHALARLYSERYPRT